MQKAYVEKSHQKYTDQSGKKLSEVLAKEYPEKKQIVKKQPSEEEQFVNKLKGNK